MVKNGRGARTVQQQPPQQPKPQTDADARIAAEVSVSDPGARRTMEGLLRLCGIRGSDAGSRTLLLRITDDLSAQADPSEGLCATVLLVPRERIAGVEFSGFPRSGPVFVLGTPILLEEGEAVLSSARAILCGLGTDDSGERDIPDPSARPAQSLERDPAGLAERSSAPRAYPEESDPPRPSSADAPEDPVQEQDLRAAPVSVSPDGREVSYLGRTARLTAREAAYFRILYERRGEAVSREELLSSALEGAGAGQNRSNLADVYMGYLRKKLRPVFGEGALLSVRGRGYLLNLPGD